VFNKKLSSIVSISLLAILILPWGCKRQEPVYQTDKDLGDQEQTLLPNTLALSYDQEMLSSPVETPNLDSLSAASQPEEVPIDSDSESVEEDAVPAPGSSDVGKDFPEISALITRHNELLRAGQTEEALLLYTPEFREYARVNFILTEKMKLIVNRIADEVPMAAMLRPMIEAHQNVELVSAVQKDENNITGKMGISTMPGMTIPATFARVDDQWLVSSSQNIAPDKIVQIKPLIEEKISRLDTILMELDTGDLDSQSAAGQLQQIVTQMQMQIMQITQGLTAQSEDSLPAAVPSAAPVAVPEPGEAEAAQGGLPNDESGISSSSDTADSSPPEIRALITQRNELLQTNDPQAFDQVVNLYVPELRELTKLQMTVRDQMRRIFESFEPGNSQLTQIRLLYDAGANLTLVTAKKQHEDKAVGSIAVNLPGASQSPPNPMVFIRLDGQWLFAGSPGTDAEKISRRKILYQEASQNLVPIVSGLKEGSLGKEAASQQFLQAIMGLVTQLNQISSEAAVDQGVLAENPKISELFKKRNELFLAMEFRKASLLYVTDFREAAAKELEALEKMGVILEKLKGTATAEQGQELFGGFMNCSAISAHRQDNGTMLVEVKLGSSKARPKKMLLREENGEWFFIAEDFAVDAGPSTMVTNLSSLMDQVDGMLYSLENNKVPKDVVGEQASGVMVSLARGIKPGRL